ncbi:MAG: flavin reductase family protein [Opitutaceae bacterium]
MPLDFAPPALSIPGALMLLDFSQLAPRDAYAWMIGTILPRPIAWVSTISTDGRTNLAPFSFFQGVTANPPTLMFVPVNLRDGTKKDTVRNIEQVPEFAVNLVSFALAESMNATAALLPYGESEFEKFGIAMAASQRIRPPRVADAPVAFECKLERIVQIGEGPLAANVVFGSILLAHVSDSVLGADGRPDAGKLDLIGRMGGESYTRTTERFALKRPDR